MMSMRMPSLNKVLITGNLVDDPEARLLESGINVANFRIASTQSYRGRDGEWKEKTCFIDVVAWRRTAELIGEFLRKGSPVLVEGELQTNSWQAQDGSQRSRIEILARRVQFLQKERAASESPDQGPAPARAVRREQEERSVPSEAPEDDYDDIPF
ncbi:single-stranded DNA-binding protein [Candidatus Fermentibacterales bacterium]|nr:single-stranded DNA-binding protein [Candidatus Fermentibacterales bacterium]